MKDNFDFRVVKIANAGFGVEALRDLQAGEILLTEKPLIVVEAGIKDENISWREKVQYLQRKVSNLPKKKQKMFMSLHDCKQEDGKGKSISGIFRTNNFALGPDPRHADHGVFHLSSRLNHSCFPNCETVWNQETGVQSVIVIRETLRGEELTLCYLNEDDRYSDVDKRRHKLEQYGFFCTCKACLDEEECGGHYLKKLHDLKDSLNHQTEQVEDTCLKIDEILEDSGSKLMWRIRNLEKYEEQSTEISNKLNYLKSLISESNFL